MATSAVKNSYFENDDSMSLDPSHRPNAEEVKSFKESLEQALKDPDFDPDMFLDSLLN
jgi:hypothetical protein